MKKSNIMNAFLLVLLCSSCLLNRKGIVDVSGVYKIPSSNAVISLFSNQTYQLYDPDIRYPNEIFSGCDYTSKGFWKLLDSNIIEITSSHRDEKFLEYEIIEGNKMSADSLYVDVIFQSGFVPPGKLLFSLGSHDSYKTDKHSICIPRKHFGDIFYGLQSIALINEIIHGDRIKYIYINLFHSPSRFLPREYNHIVLKFKSFNNCSYIYQRYYQDYIRVDKSNNLIWDGREWIKIK